MEERHRKLLKANRINLARDLDIDGATSHLYANDILSENDRDSIQGITGQKPKSEKLLDILPRRGPEAFDRFVQFLDKEQPFLAVLLKPSSSEGRVMLMVFLFLMTCCETSQFHFLSLYVNHILQVMFINIYVMENDKQFQCLVENTWDF